MAAFCVVRVADGTVVQALPGGDGVALAVTALARVALPWMSTALARGAVDLALAGPAAVVAFDAAWTASASVGSSARCARAVGAAPVI